MLLIFLILTSFMTTAANNQLDTDRLTTLRKNRLKDPLSVKKELLDFLPYVSELKYPERLLYYNTLALIYTEIAVRDSALTYNNICLSELDKSDDLELHFDVYNTQGRIYDLLNMPDSAMHYFELMGKIAFELQDTIQLATYYNNIAMVEDELGNRLVAYESYMMALSLFEYLDDQESLAVAYNNIADINQTLGEYEKSIQYLDQAIEINKSLNNLINLGMNYNNIGISYKELGRYDEARNAYEQSIALARQTGSVYDEARAEYNLANLYEDLGFFDKAKNSYLRSLKVCSDNDIDYGVMLNYSGLAELYESMENWEQCEYFASQTLQLGLEFRNYNSIRSGYRILSLISEKKNNFGTALELYKKYHQAEDTVKAQNQRDVILELQTKYDSERQVLENQALKLRNEQQEHIIREQQFITLIVSSTLIFVLILVFILIRTQRRLRKVNNQINKLNHDIHEQNKVLEDTVTTKDKLFSIIGHDLRSPFNSMLGFLNMMVDDFDSFEKEEQKAILKEFYKKSIDLHNLVENLLQWALQQKGEISYNPDINDLRMILDDEISFLNSRAEIKEISIQNDVPVGVLAYCDRDMIKTVFRNIINNAIKFTPVKGRIIISSGVAESEVTIRFCDSGIGMDASRIEQILHSTTFDSIAGTNKEIGVGLGLKIVKEFIQINKGRLSITSEPNKGSCFIVQLNAGKGV
ncbi:MAG: tetratricopeptide repeat-containing sensor histidine kinase [Bacteroidales bacterium]|nr:tetratricopeptide repeat-containing sensor histidine kinase [Bacteroidales bacterium]HOI31466.1 tetratricopeptide repeat-containing sensor histidine kinase [Bacteroidales bacterium]